MPSTSREILYVTPKQGFIPGIGDEADDDDKEKAYGRGEEENIRIVSSP